MRDDIPSALDSILKAAKGVCLKKYRFVQRGYNTWEMFLFVATLIALLLTPLLMPGLLTAPDTTPNSEPYDTVITFEQASGKETFVDIECHPSNFITAEDVAYFCDFRFESSNGSLRVYREEYVQSVSGSNLFWKEWTTRTDPETRLVQGAVRSLTPDFTHRIKTERYHIYGTFGVVAPEEPDIYDFSIILGERFGGERGDVDTVTVFSPAEASTFETREFLLPFQRLIIVGILLSIIKLWMSLFDRIESKIMDRQQTNPQTDEQP